MRFSEWAGVSLFWKEKGTLYSRKKNTPTLDQQIPTGVTFPGTGLSPAASELFPV